MGIARVQKFLSDDSILHDPNIPKLRAEPLSRMQTRRQSQQLRFSLEEKERAAFQRAKPIPNDLRRSLNAEALTSHYEANREFWTALKKEVQPRINHDDDPCVHGVERARLEYDDICDLLLAVSKAIDLKIRPADHELADLVFIGLSSLVNELRAPEPDYSVFRTLWLLIWPILNDFNLLPSKEVNFRIGIQRLLAKSF